MSEKRKYRIMFVCSGNTCRSPMAQYALQSLLEKERPGQSEICSSGTLGISGRPATPYAQEAGKIWDLDLSSHRSQGLNADLIRWADLIFAMAPEHHKEILRQVPDAAARTYLLKNFPDHGSGGEAVDDPIGADLDRYNEVFLEIGEYLGKYLPEILKRLDEAVNAQ